MHASIKLLALLFDLAITDVDHQVFKLLQADICLLPNDERTERVRVLARDFCAKRDGQKEPIFLTHPMLPGLLQVCSSLHIFSWCASKANLTF